MTAPATTQAGLDAEPVESLWPEPRTRRQTRARNRLRAHGIDTIGHLLHYSAASLREVRDALVPLGVHLPGDEGSRS